jgi:hypothetical protein
VSSSLVLAAALVLAAVVGAFQITPPAVVPAPAPASEFSAERDQRPRNHRARAASVRLACRRGGAPVLHRSTCGDRVAA